MRTRFERHSKFAAIFASQKEIKPKEKKAWGGWATLGFGLAIVAVYIGTTILTIVGFMLLPLTSRSATSLAQFVRSVVWNEGKSFVAVGTIATAGVCVPLILLFARLRRNISIGEYLGLKKVRWQALTAWLAVTLVLVALLQTLILVAKNLGNQNVATTSATGTLPLIFWVGAIVFAPAFEETFFRGFIFKGLSESRLGVISTILLMSVTWSALHFEYGLLSLAVILVFGVCLGVARYRTNSLWAPFLMHAFWNTLTLSAALLFRKG